MICLDVGRVGGGQLGRAAGSAANRAGLTALTRLSVVCADSTVTIEQLPRGLEVELAAGVGIGLGEQRLIRRARRTSVVRLCSLRGDGARHVLKPTARASCNCLPSESPTALPSRRRPSGRAWHPATRYVRL